MSAKKRSPDHGTAADFGRKGVVRVHPKTGTHSLQSLNVLGCNYIAAALLARIRLPAEHAFAVPFKAASVIKRDGVELCYLITTRSA